MKKGFDRLKGVAAASAMGLGMLGAGSGRAASLPPSGSKWLGTTLAETLAVTISSKNLTVFIGGIGGRSVSDTFGIGSAWVSVSTTPIFNKVTASYTSKIVTSYLTGTPSITVTSMITTTVPVGTHPIASYPTNIVFSNMFDGGALGMVVDGTVFKNPDNTIDFTDGVISSDLVINIVDGIDAQIQYAFAADRGDTSVGAVRAMYTLTNSSATEKSITVNVFGALASTIWTTIEATSSGNLLADDTDQWTVSTDTAQGIDPWYGWSPAMVVSRYGTGASVVPTQTSVLGAKNDPTYANIANNVFANDYALTIPAGETQRILVFVEAHLTNAGAEAAAADFESYTAAKNAGALEGLTTEQLKEVVNYKYVAPPSSDSGAFGLSALFAMFGIPALLRRFRKDK